MLLKDTTPLAPGTYHDGDDLSFDSIQKVSSLGVTIVQTQGNIAPAMRISGYDNPALDPANTIATGTPELGKISTIKALTQVQVFEFGNSTPVAFRSVTDAATTTVASRANVSITFQKADGSTWVFGVDAPNLAVYAVVQNLQAADSVIGRWVAPINHELVEATKGAFDVGRVTSVEGTTTSANVGKDMFVRDDGPTASLSSSTVELLHDEKAGVNPTSNDQPDAALPAHLGGFGSLKGWAQSTGSVVTIGTSTSVGTDTPGSQTLSLFTPADRTDSGLKAIVNSSTGEEREVSLFNETSGGVSVVVGRIDTSTGAADPAGTVAFVMSLNSSSGVLSFAQYLPILHLNAAGTANVEVVSFANNSVKVKLTVKDEDQDTATQDVDISPKIKIRDDGLAAGTGAIFDLEEDDLDNLNVSGGVILGGSKGLNDDGLPLRVSHTITDLKTFFTVGIDQPVRFELDATKTSTLPKLLSKGAEVKYDVSFNSALQQWTLTGYADTGTTSGVLDASDRKVFTWVVPATGINAIFTLLDQMDHATPVERNDSLANDDSLEETGLKIFGSATPVPTINLTGVLKALDRDLTVATATDLVEYRVQDDMPDIGDNGASGVSAADRDKLPNGVIQFLASNSTTQSLEARIGSDEGRPAGGGPSVTIETATSQINYASGLTLKSTFQNSKQALLYYRDANGDNVLNFTDANGNGRWDPGEAGEDVFFRLTVNTANTDSSRWTYTWASFQNAPPVETSVNFNAIKSGGPQELLSPPVGTSGKLAFFDGLLFTSGLSANDWAPGANHDPVADNDGTKLFDLPTAQTINGVLFAADRDDGNPDAEGFGVKDGQASQFNHNEGFLARVKDGASYTTMSSLKFAIEGIGSVKDVNIDWQIVNGSSVVSTGTELNFALPSGNAERVFDKIKLADGSGFDAVYVRVWLDGAPANKGVRLLDFKIGEPQPTEDKIVDATLKIIDFDGDYDVASVKLGIDGSDPDTTVIFPT